MSVRTVSILWLLLCVGRGALADGKLADLDTRNGFRDLHFGDAVPETMTLVTTDGKTNYYTRPSDDLTIGAAKAQRISYKFYGGHLAGVLIETKGAADSHALLDVLKKDYGPGNKSNQFLEDRLWTGERVLLSYQENPTKDAKAMFHSVPLLEEENTDKANAAKKGVRDL